jgi:hypothetical protein
MNKLYENIHTGVVYRESFRKGQRILVEVNDEDYCLPLTTKEFELLDLNGEVVMENWGAVNLKRIDL